jgi:hypothetical protein
VLCVVPLAGPDFHDPAYGVKPFIRVGEETLIEATLGRRPWLRSGQMRPSDIAFVLRDTAHGADASVRLAEFFPGSRFVFLSDGTGGALQSALAAACFVGDGPVVVDLADLAFDTDAGTAREIAAPAGDGFIPWFPSSDPAYSYLRFDGDRIVETAEKRVISDRASAGVYTFASASHFLRAAAGCLADPEAYRVNGALFLCPAYNVLIGQGCRIQGGEVSSVRSYSKQFHAQRARRPEALQFADEAAT